MHNDIDGGEKLARKSRVEKPVVKAEERKTTRVRPKGSALRDRLSVPDEIRAAYPDCYFVWENNEKGKIKMREDNGWEVVRGDFLDGSWQPGEKSLNTGSVYSIPVGLGETTSNLEAVLMMIPIEWWEEDLKAQKEEYQKVENSLRRGSKHGETAPDGSYDPRLPNGGVGFSKSNR